ncbi:hypothetical protein [Algibacter aquimarinus]|uniref:Uncharacterized protein n=1 Tax=Algibacter aquimarinus TaxID=1136748 RepID=A0ABP9HFT4_9FLAO
MGYMGFGMQSWVYKKRPRKPFSKRGRIPSFSPFQEYSRTFKIKSHTKESKYKYTLWGIIFFISLIFLVTNYTKKFTLYTNEKSIVRIKAAEKIDNRAFVFLIKSGKKRLISNNIIGAYSEFNLAYQIKPNNEELNQLLIETLSILCDKNTDYCDDLNYHLDSRF